MASYSKTYEVIWADMDPNRHMRHSVYNDYAAQTRVSIFADHGFPMDRISKLGLGPILFREETRFLKEIVLSERITVTCQVMTMREDGSKWSFLHEIFKEDGGKAAEITVDGAWLDLDKRKIGIPPAPLKEIILRFPRTKTFSWLPAKGKNS